MRVLGVDPGTKATGYGFLNAASSGKVAVLEAGTITPKPRDALYKRIHTVHVNLAELIREYKPEVMVLEKIYAHHKYPTTAGILGHVRGVICLLCAEHDIQLEEHSVKRIRKTVTGNGNATKSQTQRAVCHILNINSDQLTLDASDALALAYGYIQMAGR